MALHTRGPIGVSIVRNGGLAVLVSDDACESRLDFGITQACQAGASGSARWQRGQALLHIASMRLQMDRGQLKYRAGVVPKKCLNAAMKALALS